MTIHHFPATVNGKNATGYKFINKLIKTDTIGLSKINKFFKKSRYFENTIRAIRFIKGEILYFFSYSQELAC